MSKIEYDDGVIEPLKKHAMKTYLDSLKENVLYLGFCLGKKEDRVYVPIDVNTLTIYGTKKIISIETIISYIVKSGKKIQFVKSGEMEFLLSHIFQQLDVFKAENNYKMAIVAFRMGPNLFNFRHY